MPLSHPNNSMDYAIGSSLQTISDRAHSVLLKDERLEVAAYTSTLSEGLFYVYPFQCDRTVLQIGSNFGSYTQLLSQRCIYVTVLESDAYRAHCAKLRCAALHNVSIIKDSFMHFSTVSKEKYDYVLYIVDPAWDNLPDEQAYRDLLKRLKLLLKPRGTLLMVVPNRLGLQYLCGAPDPRTGHSFDGITQNDSTFYRMNRKQLLRLFQQLGFLYTKLYYPFPDWFSAQLVYTDEYLPGEELIERIGRYYCTNQHDRVLDERNLALQLAENGGLLQFSNSFLVEASQCACSTVVHGVITSTRAGEQSMATVIHSDDTVYKFPICQEGKTGIERLLKNTRALREHGIPVLPMERYKDGLKMQCIHKPTLLQYLSQIRLDDPEILFSYLDQLWAYILQSSDWVPRENNWMRESAPDADWGPILKFAYLEMIPANCFYLDGELLFYDQEFVLENCPASYILYRVIQDIYTFIPDAKQFIPLQQVQKRYGLKEIWPYLKEAVDTFHRELGQDDQFPGMKFWGPLPLKQMKQNRRRLSMETQCKLDGSFNTISGLEGQRIILFGSGRYADYYLDQYEEMQKPAFLIDNDPKKWGHEKRGYQIKNPSVLTELVYGTFQVIVTILDYVPIVEQLERMGIHSDSYRIFNRQMIPLLRDTLTDTMTEGKYNVGYVTGVFDLFHIGHLNLLRNCKKRCHYLIAGVLTDQLAARDKDKVPFIPFEERLEIVKQCKYVDRVYTIDFHNTDKVEAWKELHYGCLFSGSDHASDPGWLFLKTQLKSLGSDLEFFPYTKTTSSTILQKALSTYCGNE